MTDPLKAPFPWFGGKSRAAHLIWPRFGDVPNYVEPFAGSLAVLLARPHAPHIETVNDADAMLANFWRSIRYAPDTTAEWAEWPVNETDLRGRHKWLVARIPEVRSLLDGNPEAHDPKVAGWWAWGLCAWIGTGWCVPSGIGNLKEQPPRLTTAGGQGVHSLVMRELSRQLPNMGGNSGRDINALSARSRIPEVFQALSSRLRYTRVACGDFERVLSDSVTWRHGTTAIMLDPPYAEGSEVYGEGDAGTFARCAAWAQEHGADTRLRICLCGYEDTWSPPEGWATIAWKAHGGYGWQRKDGVNENPHRERLWFSPGCLATDGREHSRISRKQAAEDIARGQGSLFAALTGGK